MRYRWVIAVSLLAMLAGASGQESLSRRKVSSDAVPVTMAECSATFQKLERVVSRLTGSPLNLPKMSATPVPAKRTEILVRMDRIFELAKPHINFTPKGIAYDPKALALPVGHPQRPILERLVRWGFVGRTTPLAASKSESIGATDFGDAIGLFILRLADVTHRPDPKYSPMLGGGLGG